MEDSYTSKMNTWLFETKHRPRDFVLCFRSVPPTNTEAQQKLLTVFCVGLLSGSWALFLNHPCQGPNVIFTGKNGSQLMFIFKSVPFEWASG